MRRQSDRRDVFERYIGEIAGAVNRLNGTDTKKLYEILLSQARRRTAIADQLLDEEGKVIKDDPAEQEGVLIVESAMRPDAAAPVANGESPPLGKPSKAERARLRVAAMAKDEDQPKLMDVEPVKRSARKEKPTKPPASKPAGSRPAPTKPAKASNSPTPPSARPAKPPKPKMRIVNGKLVPVDDGPRLF
jgi:hypothetical protein